MNRWHAELMQRSLAVSGQRAVGVRLGEVTSVDPNRHAAKVMLQPEGVLTGWLPVPSQWIGNGWGLAAPPSVGDQVVVAFQEADNDHGVVLGRAYSDAQQPPAAPAGEWWLVHQSGSTIRLLNSGSVLIQSDLHTKIVVGGNASLTVTGNLTATVGGNTTLDSTGTVTVDASNIALNANTTIGGTLNVEGDIIGSGANISLQHHKHSDVQTGTGNTGEPVPGI